MSERDRHEEAPAPGHWRVIAQPVSTSPSSPAPTAAQGAGAPAAAAPVRTGGRPLIATLICVGLLLLWLAGGRQIHPQSGGVAYAFGVAVAGGIFGSILWAIAFAITLRKASKRWKWGSLVGLAMVGGLVALAKIGTPAAPSLPVVQVPVVPTGK